MGALVVLIGGGLASYMLWYTKGRDLPPGVVAAAYTSPHEDTPTGMVGTLLDEKVDMRDILATMVDLARRGYFQIVEHEEEGFFKKSPGDFTFVRGDASPNLLRPFEKRLFDTIFGMSRSERTLSSLKNQFYKEIGDIQREL